MHGFTMPESFYAATLQHTFTTLKGIAGDGMIIALHLRIFNEGLLTRNFEDPTVTSEAVSPISRWGGADPSNLILAMETRMFPFKG